MGKVRSAEARGVQLQFGSMIVAVRSAKGWLSRSEIRQSRSNAIRFNLLGRGQIEQVTEVRVVSQRVEIGLIGNQFDQTVVHPQSPPQP